MCSLTVAIPCVEWTGFDRINPGGSECLVSCRFFLHTMREFFSLTVVPPHQQDNTCNSVHNHYAWPSGLLNCGKSFSIEQKAASLIHQTGGEYPRCECVTLTQMCSLFLCGFAFWALVSLSLFVAAHCPWSFVLAFFWYVLLCWWLMDQKCVWTHLWRLPLTLNSLSALRVNQSHCCWHLAPTGQTGVIVTDAGRANS